MADAGGSLLLRAGLITETALHEAQRMRQQEGGSLVEWLIALGTVDEERVVDFFHRHLLVPRVADRQLERVPRKVLATVPADMAAEFGVCPVELDEEGTLTLAMADPSDASVADEVMFFTERFCQRAVAPATLLRAAIEHHYGVKLPALQPPAQPLAVRDIGPLASEHEVERGLPAPPPRRETPPLGSRTPASRPAAPLHSRVLPALPAPPPVGEEPIELLTQVKRPAPRTIAEDELPLPGVTVHNDWSVARPIERPEPRAAQPPVERPVTRTIETVAVEPVAEDGSDEAPIMLTRPVARAPEPIPLTKPVSRPTPPIELTKPVARARSSRITLTGLPVLTFPDPPLGALRAATSRDQIALVLLEYLATMVPRAALFVMRRGVLSAYGGCGAELNVEALRYVALPIDSPSLFRDVIQSRLPYRGTLPDTPANRVIIDAVGELRGDVLLYPIAVRGRVVAILYADGVTSPLPDATLHAVAREAGRAYERNILDQKR